MDGMTGQMRLILSEPADYEYGRVVHPDGTVFILAHDSIGARSIVGVDTTTGGQKFSVPIPNGGVGDFGLIVAGDGYAYTPSATRTGCGPNCEVNHLSVLRISSSGAVDTIPVLDWSSNIYDIIPVDATIITNADTGILLSIKATDQYYLATTNGTSVSVRAVGQMIPGQANQVEPMLQAQDGSFVGRGSDDLGSPYMVAFDANGNVRWSVPDQVPGIALADGGVIATGLYGDQAQFYDQSGTLTRRVAGFPGYSWLGNAYSAYASSISQVPALPLYVAQSFWPFSGANRSGNRGALQEARYFPLVQCTNPNCVGPRDAIYNALFDLIVRLSDARVAAAADANIFMRPNHRLLDANGIPLDTRGFIRYLAGKKPDFYDGTKSTFCFDWLTPPPLAPPCSIGHSISPGTSVGDYYIQHPATTALTATPSFPLLVFFRPSGILYQNYGRNLGNEGLIFHEALHGATRLYDLTLQLALGISTSRASCNIGEYIQDFVLKLSNGLDGTIDPCP